MQNGQFSPHILSPLPKEPLASNLKCKVNKSSGFPVYAMAVEVKFRNNQLFPSYFSLANFFGHHIQHQILHRNQYTCF
jgi:hypothetical protein